MKPFFDTTLRNFCVCYVNTARLKIFRLHRSCKTPENPAKKETQPSNLQLDLHQSQLSKQTQAKIAFLVPPSQLAAGAFPGLFSARFFKNLQKKRIKISLTYFSSVDSWAISENHHHPHSKSTSPLRVVSCTFPAFRSRFLVRFVTTHVHIHCHREIKSGFHCGIPQARKSIYWHSCTSVCKIPYTAMRWGRPWKAFRRIKLVQRFQPFPLDVKTSNFRCPDLCSWSCVHNPNCKRT